MFSPKHVLAQGSSAGFNLFVKDTCDSSHVAMTHAWPPNADVWNHQAAELSKVGFRVISPDRRRYRPIEADRIS